ncbi:hypothetical protein PInf_008578 [Phytophthora infestans]|nr:hypothetical protein PInf_008578 [Phytophthora infestans]
MSRTKPRPVGRPRVGGKGRHQTKHTVKGITVQKKLRVQEVRLASRHRLPCGCVFGGGVAATIASTDEDHDFDRWLTAEEDGNVELVVDSTDQLRVSFVLSNLSGRGKSLVYTREVTSPGCFTSWAQLVEQLRAAFLPVNNEYCQRPRPLSSKQGRRELHKYIQEMGELTASLVGNPLNKHIKVTVFMDGFRVSPARTQLFRVLPSTLEETLQVDLREEYSHRQVRSRPQRDQSVRCQIPAGRTPLDQFPWRLGPPNSAICFVCGKLDHFKHDVPAERPRRRTFPKPILKGLRQKPRPRDQGNAGDQ